MIYKLLIRPIFFSIDPEKTHHIALNSLKFLISIPGMKSLFEWLFAIPKGLEVQKLGLKFRNPVGLAAGFDKDGKYIEALDVLGFGFIEVGTVTPLPQAGNDKPRLFRLPVDKGIINRMGFNNEGVDALVERLKLLKNRSIIIGGNIGKNKVTPNDKAIDDYLTCFHKLHDYVDYFVVNVSSPNTPGLRALQEKGPLTEILTALVKANFQKAVQKPILLKIAPDLGHEQVMDIIDIVRTTQIQGLIATNTTISRSDLKTASSKVSEIGMGGLSGKPVRQISDQILNMIKINAPEIFVIGVGGIFDGQDAKDKMDLGADLVQVYSGFIYEGPAMISNICKFLSKSA
ncbi:MAG: quinone-dependent dihydroorotate dehydrogenase [Saprospiraceae bacterium]|nr:quinone-dependent dihydroorotate dehydrogenase [Saprospiraceae bacterium]